MHWNDLDKQTCSMSRTLSVIGDRWTLLILRDCFLGVRRFDDFQGRLGVGRRLLSERLQKLVDSSILTRVVYQDGPTRHEYRLTEKGIDFYPVVLSIVHWGDVHMVGPKGRPLLHQHKTCGHTFDPVLACSECSGALDPRQVEVLPGPAARSKAHLPVETGKLAARGAIKAADSRARRKSRIER